MKFKIGDKVAYSVQFLKSIGESPTGEMCHCRGEITGLTEYSPKFVLATIKWDNPNIPEKVNCFNLAKVGPNMKFCQC